jgi:capsular exopolysaccharide synthesis family protein
MDAVATNARRSLSDAADRLRTRVLHELKSVNKPILLVTSAVPGEGKSTLAAELSRSMARGGLKTLLIDADFFRPAVHRHFKLPQAPGFSEVLRAEVSMPGPDQACTPGGVCVLPAGLVDERALAELSRGSFAAKIAEARAAFDVVIIDSSPVEAAVHPLVLGLSVDGVLISVLSRVSCVPPTQAAYRKLTDLGIHILGSVMSGVATSSRYNSYYYTPGHESEQHRMA